MKLIFKELAISVIYWTFVVMVGVTVRFVGLEFILEEPITVPLSNFYYTSIPGGILGGLLWGFIEIVNDRFSTKKRKSFGSVVLSRTVVYVIIFMIITFMAAWIGSGSMEFASQYLIS